MQVRWPSFTAVLILVKVTSLGENGWSWGEWERQFERVLKLAATANILVRPGWSYPRAKPEPEATK